MGAPRQALLRISEIVSIVEVGSENVVVRIRDGREFAVIAADAVECWMGIKDVLDPQSDSGPLPARDPFVQFALKG